jgi:hypothetical protein
MVGSIIMGAIFFVGMASMIMFFFGAYSDLSAENKGVVKFIGFIVLLFAIGNLGNVLGFWGN